MNKTISRGVVLLLVGFLSTSVSFAEDTGASGSQVDPVFGSGSVNPLSGLVSWAKNLFSKNPAQAAAEKKESTDPGLSVESGDLIKNVNLMVSSGVITDSAFPLLNKGLQLYEKSWAGCVKWQNTAAKACLETTSPTLAAMLPKLGMLTAAVGSSVNDSCSKFASGMEILQAALGAYAAACGMVKASCGLTCVQARKGLESIKAGLEKSTPVCNNPEDPGCSGYITSYNSFKENALPLVQQELAKENPSSTAGKASLCTEKYTELALAAGAGILSAANSFKQASNCEKASSADGTSVAQTLEQKCAIEANAQLKECICYKNPLIPGCDSSGRSTMSAGGLSSGASEIAGKNAKGGGLSGTDLSDGSLADHGAGKGGSAAGGAPAPAGGGSAGLGGGGGSGSSREVAGESSGKGLNTNILSGAGGGGGGGSWGSGGGGIDSGKGYRSYLPGGDKDPNKMAGQQSWANEVTGQGGKSNWEKIKERYRDNKGTLLSN